MMVTNTPIISKSGATNFDTSLFLKKLQIPLQNIHLFETIDSTNAYAKTMASLQEKTLIITDSQYAGKGTNQRAFISPSGGLYFSLLFFPKLPVAKLQYMTIIAGIAVVEAIIAESNNQIIPDIKWLNDIYLNQRKLGGILVEGKIVDQAYESIVMGIGLNLANLEIPEELRDIVSSVEKETGILLNREALLAKILNIFEQYYQQLLAEDLSFMETYRSYNFLLGKTLYHPKKNEYITIKSINESGHLVIESLGEEKILQVGNSSLHGFKIQ